MASLQSHSDQLLELLAALLADEAGDLIEHRQQILERHEQVRVDATFDRFADAVLVVSPDANDTAVEAHLVNSLDDGNVQAGHFRNERGREHFHFSPATGLRIHDDKSVARHKSKLRFLHSARVKGYISPHAELRIICRSNFGTPRSYRGGNVSNAAASPQRLYEDRREHQRAHQNHRSFSNPVEMHVVSAFCIWLRSAAA